MILQQACKIACKTSQIRNILTLKTIVCFLKAKGAIRKLKKNKSLKIHDAEVLAKSLGLSPSDAHRWELRSQLVTKIIEIAEREKITHTEIAKRARTSRTRVTSITNRNIDDVSTDLLLRILESLGYRVTFSVVRQRAAA